MSEASNLGTDPVSVPASWTVKRLAPALGGEVSGLNIANLSDDEFAVVESLLLEHRVLFLPAQHPNMDNHVRFARRFGELEGHPNLKNAFTDHPEIFELAASKGGIADEWHTDITFQESPAKASILHMVKCPETGGDTMWSSLYAAYDALSEPMKDLCEGLTALHDALPHNRPDKMAIHPVVRTHPVTGRKALYVNEHFTRRIVEMSSYESDMLLSYLTRWVTNPVFTVRYHWTAGTVAIWDNRCTQHFVLNDFEGERIIQRATVMGDKVDGVNAGRYQSWVRPGPLSATSRHDRQLYMFLQSQAGKQDLS